MILASSGDYIKPTQLQLQPDSRRHLLLVALQGLGFMCYKVWGIQSPKPHDLGFVGLCSCQVQEKLFCGAKIGGSFK